MAHLPYTQKNALTIILQDEYLNHSNALIVTGLKSLFERRNDLCIIFAIACTRNEQKTSMFLVNAMK